LRSRTAEALSSVVERQHLCAAGIPLSPTLVIDRHWRGGVMTGVQPAVVAPAPADQSDVIEIVGSRPDQALKIDRRTYRVQQNAHTEQKDSVQLLRGLPAVTITPDDQIQLLGASNVTIQIDGRTLTDPDTIAFLRTRHGSDIERIEVITNPSAQYAAQG